MAFPRPAGDGIIELAALAGNETNGATDVHGSREHKLP